MEHQIPLKIHYLTRDELKKPKHLITKKSKVLHPFYLMKHELFAKHRPILLGGAALSIHHRSMKCKEIYNRDIDDLDFYVTDKSAYE
jgi:cobalamin-dependent methionine synthase I